ncbi:MAG: hypothetical protein ACKOFG_13530 [Limnohabitans sp.]
MRTARWTALPRPPSRARLAVLALAFVSGGAWPLLWWGGDRVAMAKLDAELVLLRGRLQAPTSAPMRPLVPAAQDLSDGPRAHDATALWTWLQQGAQAHGLQVLALSAQPVQEVAGLPEQVLRWRLRGPWQSWLDLAQALDVQAPWWLQQQWQVVPDGQLPGWVRIDLQGRVGLQPQGGAAPAAGPRMWPAWRPASASMAAATPVFALPALAGLAATDPAPVPASSAASAESGPLPPDPRHWPVRELQLLGLWWQAGMAHAVLGRGLAQVTVSTGQRIGREAYRVRRIGPAGVELQAPGVAAQAPVLQLTWSGQP